MLDQTILALNEWLQTVAEFNPVARGAHKPDVSVLEEVRQPLLLSQVVALGLAQALSNTARKPSLIPMPRPLGASMLDPGGAGSLPSLRSSAGPRLARKRPPRTIFPEAHSNAQQQTAFLTLMVRLRLSSQRSGTTSFKMS